MVNDVNRYVTTILALSIYSVNTVRAAILTAAASLYREEGSDRLSMRRVADRLGVSATALYRHFENKDALVREIVEEGRREFAFLLHQSLGAGSPRQRFDAALDAYLGFVTDRPDYYAALFLSPRTPLSPPLPRAFEKKRPPSFQFLLDRVEECIRAGVFAGTDSIEVAIACWTHVHGFAALYLSGFFGAESETFRQTVHRSFELLIAGIGGSLQEEG